MLYDCALCNLSTEDFLRSFRKPDNNETFEHYLKNFMFVYELDLNDGQNRLFISTERKSGFGVCYLPKVLTEWDKNYIEDKLKKVYNSFQPFARKRKLKGIKTTLSKLNKQEIDEILEFLNNNKNGK